MIEVDPNGISAKTPGAKLDMGKAPIFRGLIDYFPNAVEMTSLVSNFGAEKYSWKGWETVPDGINRYRDALCRHLTKQSKVHWDSADDRLAELVFGKDWTGSDDQVKILHQAQIVWNAMATLELMKREYESG